MGIPKVKVTVIGCKLYERIDNISFLRGTEWRVFIVRGLVYMLTQMAKYQDALL
jgi:hypothetical protein